MAGAVTPEKIQAALALLKRFERETQIKPHEADQLVASIFAACGYNVETGFVGNDRGADCYVRGMIDGKLQTIAVEIKSYESNPVGQEIVRQASKLIRQGPMFTRAMVISRTGFTPDALATADTLGLGVIDLLGPAALRDWIAKQTAPEEVAQTHEAIVRCAMRQLADLVAQNPIELSKFRWWEVEDVLREAFEGIGYDTKKTRSTKDGGFDLELTIVKGGQKEIYLVEVKHWTDQRPGSQHLKKLIKVTASRMVQGSLLLSSSGFTSTIYSGIAELSAPVRLGAHDKIVALCRTYYRLKNQLWMEDVDLHQELIAGTWRIGDQPFSGAS